MLSTQNLLLIITATATALMAGLFFAYSCSVIPGLARLSDKEYLSAMQSINRAIQNPIFFTVFFGTLLLLTFSAYLHYGQPLPARFLLLSGATFIYICGVSGVTIFGNVPLNEMLNNFNIQAASQEAIHAQRIAFEGRWNNLNMIRTIASLVTIILVVISCTSFSKTEIN